MPIVISRVAVVDFLIELKLRLIFSSPCDSTVSYLRMTPSPMFLIHWPPRRFKKGSGFPPKFLYTLHSLWKPFLFPIHCSGLQLGSCHGIEVTPPSIPLTASVFSGLLGSQFRQVLLAVNSFGCAIGSLDPPTKPFLHANSYERDSLAPSSRVPSRSSPPGFSFSGPSISLGEAYVTLNKNVLSFD